MKQGTSRECVRSRGGPDKDPVRESALEVAGQEQSLDHTYQNPSRWGSESQLQSWSQNIPKLQTFHLIPKINPRTLSKSFLTRRGFAANYSSGFEKVIPQHDHESKLSLLKHSVGLFPTISHHDPPFLEPKTCAPARPSTSHSGEWSWNLTGSRFQATKASANFKPAHFFKAQMITDAESFTIPNHRWSSHKSTAFSKSQTAISSVLPFNTLYACQFTAHLIKENSHLMLLSRSSRPPTASKAVLTSGTFRGPMGTRICKCSPSKMAKEKHPISQPITIPQICWWNFAARLEEIVDPGHSSRAMAVVRVPQEEGNRSLRVDWFLYPVPTSTCTCTCAWPKKTWNDMWHDIHDWIEKRTHDQITWSRLCRLHGLHLHLHHLDLLLFDLPPKLHRCNDVFFKFSHLSLQCKWAMSCQFFWNCKNVGYWYWNAVCILNYVCVYIYIYIYIYMYVHI